MALWRFNLDGTPDTTFGSLGTGAVTFQPGLTGLAGASNTTKDDTCSALQIDSQGRLVAAGYSKFSSSPIVREMALWRFTSNGIADVTFNGTGGLTFQPGGAGAAGALIGSKNDQAFALQIDSRGRYVATGISKNADGSTEMTLWRYNSDGTADTTFGSFGTGAVTFQPGGNGAADGLNASKSDQGFSLQIDSGGRYVISGRSFNTAGRAVMTLWRFNSNGSVDTSFGSGKGAVTFQTDGDGAAGASNTLKADSGVALQIDPQGRYVITGTSFNTDIDFETTLWRYLSSGSLDK
jgi:uncharacterized delta-60 repeat protein